MSASSHSSASQKSLSPTPSMAPPDIPLETLVAHLLASKRSLSSISTLWRANEIITSARAALEESVILGAQTGFLRSGFGEQVRILTTMRSGIERIYTDGQRDFKTVIKSLDAANTRLESTMELLRNTMAESALRPAGEAPRSLLTFVEESSIEVTRDALKESIRESKVNISCHFPYKSNVYTGSRDRLLQLPTFLLRRYSRTPLVSLPQSSLSLSYP